MQWKQTSHTFLSAIMAYMFFLLQITVVRGFVQQRLVSNKIENILKADPSFCPMKTKMARKQWKQIQFCYLRTRWQALRHPQLNYGYEKQCHVKQANSAPQVSSWRTHLYLTLNSQKMFSWTGLHGPEWALICQRHPHFPLTLSPYLFFFFPSKEENKRSAGSK